METLKLNKINLFDQKITAFGHGSMGGAVIESLISKQIVNKNKYLAIVKTEKSCKRLKK